MYRCMFGKIMRSRLIAVIIVFTCITVTGCRNKTHGAEDSSSSADPVAPPVIEIKNDIPESAPLPGTEEDTDDISQGQEVSEAGVAEPSPENSFYSEEISDEVFSRMQGKSFPEGCTVSRDELRYLHLLYKDINGDTHEGEMVCNVAIADRLIDIFRKLYDAGYPIEKMVLIDEYDGDDDASMSDNNTSCFNYRVVSGTTKLSKHAMGLAVDLNPRYNPYIRKIDGQQLIEPENGREYADRSNDFEYKIDKDDLAYKLFTEAGFTWGGSWKNSKDYQHFQTEVN